MSATDPRDPLDPAHRQAAHAVRLEWGPTGAAAVAAGCDVAVVVDVLSFTTTLTVALDRGITVWPYRWKDSGAAAYAAERDAVLAVGRLEARRGQAGVSLSPAAMAAVDGVERLVLPSPNGSAIAFALAGLGCAVVGASLRNAAAVAEWLRPQVENGALVAVVPAGERWPDGSLRPAVEDLWGAGAVLSHLGRFVDMSAWPPEARSAAAAHDAVRARLDEELVACASGAELVDKGFGDDVRIAAGADVSPVVPLLDGDAFRDAAARRQDGQGA
ncbi:2-phosphosulfolactate phosphatase [Nocardioides rubriscoriae]|uniref:2-phosphosulfolactate phosphatase n=1 Tax=Nocardioides rubriscoriae TaxID=642762 RepID=UPI0011E01FD4|nr:2-phosphosulfolactate phosphatase [Nocardioides rubriscoriae]